MKDTSARKLLVILLFVARQVVRLLYRDTDRLKVQQLLFWAVWGLVFPLPTANLPLCLSSSPVRDKDVSHSTRHSQGSPELQAAFSITLEGKEASLPAFLICI